MSLQQRLTAPTPALGSDDAIAPALVYNRNVVLTFTFTIFNFMAQSLCNNNSMAAYIFVLTNSTAQVGWAEGMQGIVTVLVGLPTGLLADKVPRPRVLKMAGVVGVAALVATATAVCVGFVLLPSSALSHSLRLPAALFTERGRYVLICAACGLWGAFMGVAMPPLEAIFGDSVATGARSGLYTKRYSLGMLASSIGPLFAVGFFYFHGNRWTVDALAAVMLVGVGVAVIPIGCTFLFVDSATLGDASEAVGKQKQPERSGGSGTPGVPKGEAAHAPFTEDRCGIFRTKHILPLQMLSQLISVLGSGCTIKFFPIFFLSKVGLSPLAVNAIFAITPAIMAVFSNVAKWASSRWLGRALTIQLFSATGTALLVVMAAFPQLWKNHWVVLPIYIIRTATINSIFPLNKSIQMDYATKATRARWTSMGSLSKVSWSGSAVLGGYLIDAYGFQAAFALTAGLQFAGWLVRLPLLWLVPLVG